MSAKKTERLLNLVICLLSTRGYLDVGQIRDLVPGYGGGPDAPAVEDDEAFRRMFERDKAELREIGIPLETGSNSVWDDEPGYRIARRDYELPEISLEPDEAAAVGLAARLWQSAGLAADASSALLKLRAAGVDADSATDVLEPRVAASEPAFAAALAAVREGRRVAFGYRGASGAQATPRHVEPWGVVSWRGRWYLVGHDLDREATRAFRLSRVTSTLRALGPSGAVKTPEGTDLLAAVSGLESGRATSLARLRVRAGRAHELRRRGTVIGSADGWDELEVPFSDAERLAEVVAGFGTNALAVRPPEVRDSVVRRLRAVAGVPL